MSKIGVVAIGRNRLIIKVAIFIFFLILGIGFTWYLTFSNERVVKTKVLDIERIEKVTGDNKIGISTDIYYFVHTQDETMKVSLSGLNAYPEAIGIIKEGHEYTFRVRGASIRVLGIYQSIIKVEK